MKTKFPVVNLLEVNSLNAFSIDSSLLSDIAKDEDAEITKLKKYVTQGWPRNIPKEMLPYSKEHDEYSIENQIVFRCARIVPPKRLRSRILNLLHSEQLTFAVFNAYYFGSI